MHGQSTKVEALADVLSQGEILILTGAGISTDSGIPDYRDPDGRARNTAPMTFQRFVACPEERRRYWARSHVGWPRVAAARPNASHRAVAELEQAGLLAHTVTQNVDGLHTAAGSRQVIDLHGRLDVVACLQCHVRRPRIEIALRLDAVNPGFLEEVADDVLRPDGDVVLSDEAVARFRMVSCRRCDGPVKPDVVYFGEQVPRDRFARALDLVEQSAALVVLGSSLAVGSGYRFVTAAAKRDIPIVIVTRGLTRGDRHASLKIDAALGDVLPTATARALEPRPSGRVAGPGSAHQAPEKALSEL
ncbi:NAD-dependent protein deacetylase [Egibacter rhizosphaerae]|uniref:NAD-dependent protein deacetylase n=1 Tax=Egibacter rhizosphaerae TaxID=1670831 RepID=A0A411YBN6_9ACTN|nr:NAD-dependent protein deacetylase [Egibacter rhizosphaerae]QBI18582.1 NAD-dependent protein deacetylase [Egibacter rhizosphaerae]